ncbi:hypothetical protein OHA84_20880 [Streptomyces sp. NBC_00513]|uniref:hypothetical protein n=1 Tax=unclassified Streptomyces TaxID=2593676 RepID=UPI0022512E70|nr:hypothetical protein [Streptomyces sp. NBC_00424]MCX5074030.1 hypothetical protein [Streptomyces sp. NBC_00424]WUD42761.1 hypothetical protein OHA84_20880 [Streptomyces sp. NBC_00513]
MVAGRRVRFIAVLVGVVLALTGFSSHGGSSGKSKSKSGGGGCSSSKSGSKKKSYSGSNSNSSSSGGSGSGNSTSSPTPTAAGARAELVTCAAPGRPEATLKVTSVSGVEGTFSVSVVFEGANGRVDSGSAEVRLKAGESRAVDVPMTFPDRVADVLRCVVGRVETVSSSTARPSSTPSRGSGGTSGSTSTSRPKTTTKPKPRSNR